MMLLAYAAFLRYDELSNLKICDLEFAESHFKIFIEKSKTDQFREGAWVIVEATGKVTCPVRMLSKYVQLAEITNQDSSEFLFRPIALHKSNGQYKLRSGKMTYTRTREIVKDALKSIGLDSSKFGLHSLRAGGASAARPFVCRIGFLRDTGDGRAILPRIGMLKNLLKTECLCQ